MTDLIQYLEFIIVFKTIFLLFAKSRFVVVVFPFFIFYRCLIDSFKKTRFKDTTAFDELGHESK